MKTNVNMVSEIIDHFLGFILPYFRVDFFLSTRFGLITMNIHIQN